jgi:hypothetical protein
MASETELWVIWSQDTFGYGEDRDPPRLESIHAEQKEAESRLAQLKTAQAENNFLRFWLARQSLSAIEQHPYTSKEKIAAFLNSDSEGCEEAS